MISLTEKLSILDDFYDKLIASGHCHNDIRLIFIEALLKFNLLVKKSGLDHNDPLYRPLYLSNDFDKENRGITKYLQKFNWHDPTTSQTDNSWKQDVPVEFKTLKAKGKTTKKPLLRPSTVLFVPNSNQGILLDRLKHAEPMLSRLTGYSVRLVEASGVPLSRLFSLDLSDGRCHRLDCVVCENHKQALHQNAGGNPWCMSPAANCV